MGFEPDVLHTLARRNLPIVGCNYKTNKGWPVRFTSIAANRTESIITDDNSTGIEEAYVIPQGMTLVAREVFETVPKPWFMQGYNSEDDKYTFAQDYYFCLKAAQYGYKCFVDHDASKKIWHIGIKNYRWDVRDENTHAPRKDALMGVQYGDVIGDL
jgi:hypothetical protein